MRPFWLLVLLAAGLSGADDDYLRWDTKRANSIALAARANGQAGSSLDFRVVRTDRSYNYKLRATWLTPEVIRACARLEQLSRALTDDETRGLVKEAEGVGESVVVIEIDPREGSGVIPNDWVALLSPRVSGGPPPRSARGTNMPALSKIRALSGGQRRDYAYDIFWVVFPLRSESGGPLFGSADREAELTVRIYDKVGRIHWLIPESIRAKLQARD